MTAQTKAPDRPLTHVRTATAAEPSVPARFLRATLRQPGLALSAIFLLIVIAWVFAPQSFTGQNPLTGEIPDRLLAPSAAHPFGTDALGRDMFARVVFGAVNSVQAIVLAVGVALVVGHLVDLVLPRPQLAPGVPRGLLGLVLGVPAGAAVTFFGGDAADLSGTTNAVLFGAVLGGVAALVAVVASYLVVEATAETVETPWALSVVQVALPLAACGPVALALLTVL